MTDERTGDDLVDRLENELRTSSIVWVAPRAGECLLCYVARMVDQFGCDTTLRWARRFRDLRAPTATALERRLGQVGGFCDCEVFLNGYGLVPRRMGPGYGDGDVPASTPLPLCAGVRRASTQPCATGAGCDGSGG